MAALNLDCFLNKRVKRGPGEVYDTMENAWKETRLYGAARLTGMWIKTRAQMFTLANQISPGCFEFSFFEKEEELVFFLYRKFIYR